MNNNKSDSNDLSKQDDKQNDSKMLDQEKDLIRFTSGEAYMTEEEAEADREDSVEEEYDDERHISEEDEKLESEEDDELNSEEDNEIRQIRNKKLQNTPMICIKDPIPHLNGIFYGNETLSELLEFRFRLANLKLFTLLRINKENQMFFLIETYMLKLSRFDNKTTVKENTGLDVLSQIQNILINCILSTLIHRSSRPLETKAANRFKTHYYRIKKKTTKQKQEDKRLIEEYQQLNTGAQETLIGLGALQTKKDFITFYKELNNIAINPLLKMNSKIYQLKIDNNITMLFDNQKQNDSLLDNSIYFYDNCNYEKLYAQYKHLKPKKLQSKESSIADNLLLRSFWGINYKLLRFIFGKCQIQYSNIEKELPYQLNEESLLVMLNIPTIHKTSLHALITQNSNLIQSSNKKQLKSKKKQTPQRRPIAHAYRYIVQDNMNKFYTDTQTYLNTLVESLAEKDCSQDIKNSLRNLLFHRIFNSYIFLFGFLSNLQYSLNFNSHQIIEILLNTNNIFFVNLLMFVFQLIKSSEKCQNQILETILYTHIFINHKTFINSGHEKPPFGSYSWNLCSLFYVLLSYFANLNLDLNFNFFKVDENDLPIEFKRKYYIKNHTLNLLQADVSINLSKVLNATLEDAIFNDLQPNQKKFIKQLSEKLLKIKSLSRDILNEMTTIKINTLQNKLIEQIKKLTLLKGVSLKAQFDTLKNTQYYMAINYQPSQQEKVNHISPKNETKKLSNNENIEDFPLVQVNISMGSDPENLQSDKNNNIDVFDEILPLHQQEKPKLIQTKRKKNTNNSKIKNNKKNIKKQEKLPLKKDQVNKITKAITKQLKKKPGRPPKLKQQLITQKKKPGRPSIKKQTPNDVLQQELIIRKYCESQSRRSILIASDNKPITSKQDVTDSTLIDIESPLMNNIQNQTLVMAHEANNEKIINQLQETPRKTSEIYSTQQVQQPFYSMNCSLNNQSGNTVKPQKSITLIQTSQLASEKPSTTIVQNSKMFNKPHIHCTLEKLWPNPQYQQIIQQQLPQPQQQQLNTKLGFQRPMRLNNNIYYGNNTNQRNND